MIDIQGELLQIKQQREQTYISIVELLDFLKKQSPNSSFKDIAKWLLVKLEFNDSRNVDLFSCNDHENWEYEYEIPNFCVPLEIEDKPVELPSSSFFDALREIGDVPLFGRGISSYDYLPIDKSNIFLERSRIEKFLGFSTINNASNEIFIEKNCAIEKAQNTQLQAENERLKAELKAQQNRMAELEQKLQQSAVNSDDFSIYGHKSELLEILFKVTAEFWADTETPPKNSMIEQWIETNYPIKNYPYVSKAVRQYIATILRPQPKLK
ncbi:hypothetical protein [Haemophilus influenzae]|uniref:Uncharacterized protein n=1 Tax=Haemophilus influenzae TaxID=727 RepID=A0A2S9RQ91_HAEIF|nr:hypothetical protein [Haemophilus influenzae]PRJ62017.1 hypothetical protein BV102_01147 [Haemophilus influenzae]